MGPFEPVRGGREAAGDPERMRPVRGGREADGDPERTRPVRGGREAAGDPERTRPESSALGRRDALALVTSLLGAFAGALSGACAGGRPPPAKAATEPPLRIDPLIDLVPAAGLVWVLQARPDVLLANPSFRRAAALI